MAGACARIRASITSLRTHIFHITPPAGSAKQTRNMIQPPTLGPSISGRVMGRPATIARIVFQPKARDPAYCGDALATQ